MKLLFLVMSAFDGVIIGGLVCYIFHLIFGNHCFASVMKILFGVLSCVGYFALSFCLIYGNSDVTIGAILPIKLIPFIVAVAFFAVSYMYKNK